MHAARPIRIRRRPPARRAEAGRGGAGASRYAEQAQRLAALLRSRRDLAGLSQEELAARAEVSVATVSKIETGAVREPGYFTVVSMLDALNAADREIA